MFVRRFTTFVGAAAAASSLGLAALASAATAGAGTVDDTFISVITDQGIEPPSAGEAISVAHDVCTVIDDGGDLVDAISVRLRLHRTGLRRLGVLRRRVYRQLLPGA